MRNISPEVKIVELSTVAKLSPKIVEFEEAFDEEYFSQKINGKKSLVIAGFVESEPAGYMVSYEEESTTFYCWMAAVDPDFRRKGVLTSMLEFLCNWAKQNGYTKIRIITRNKRREMLAFLVKQGFNFISVEAKPTVEENRINLEKLL